MLGAYFPDSEHSGLPIHLTPADSCEPLFLPTAGSSAISLLSEPYYPTHQVISNRGYVSRKRLRQNECDPVSNLTPQKITSQKLAKSPSAPSPGLCDPVRESPPAFVNTAYRIAGGLDTPSAVRLDAEEIREEQMRELDYRPNRMTLTTQQESASYFPRMPVTVARNEYMGRKRARSSVQPGWSRAVADLVGGVAGKVFNFCWNGAFGGFQAGGGEAYSVKGGNPAVVQQNPWLDVGEKDFVFDKHCDVGQHRDLTPLPRQFPEDEFIDDYMSQSRSHRANLPTTPGTPEGGGVSPVRSKWVFVNNKGSIEEQDRCPCLSAYKFPRATSKPQKMSTSKVSVVEARRRPRLAPSRPSLAGSLGSSGMRPASYASTRASPGRSNASETNSSGTTFGGHHRSQSSIASPRRATEVGSRQSFTAPNSPDVERFAKQIRRKERREDESIQRLSKQLDDMIKEGKQALGTRIEVEDDTEEDGFCNEGLTEIIATGKW